MKMSIQHVGPAPAVRLEGGGASTEITPENGATYIVQRAGKAIRVKRAGGS
jgi:hypothetical protein